MGRHDLAREFFELALARAPLDERIYRNFARSLTAEGLRREAEALMVDAGSKPAATRRPTLAQLASARLEVPIAASAQPARSGLERVSMGEVRLNTAEVSGFKPLLPGRVTPQLSTAILTVAEPGTAAVPLALSRELTAPIARKETASAVKLDRPAVHEQKPVSVATAQMKEKKGKVVASSARRTDCAAGDGRGARLPATGLSIDVKLQSSASGKCSTLAGSDRRTPSFEQLWKWSARLG